MYSGDGRGREREIIGNVTRQRVRNGDLVAITIQSGTVVSISNID